jgi:hypothetical protein
MKPTGLVLARTVVLLSILAWEAVPAFAEVQSTDEAPPPTSVEESPTSMDNTFGKMPPYGQKPVTLKEKLKDTSPFFRDTKLDVNLRTFYFYRDNFDPSKSEAWALGGSISYQSGYFLDHFGVGAAFYTSQPLYAPSDRSGSLLLNSEQDGYSTWGQLYAEIKLVDFVFVDLYRKEYNTPYINKDDNRMTPNTFEAYTLLGTYGGKDGAPELRYGAGYFTKMKPRNAEGFQWMSKAAGSDAERGVFAAGANYKSKDFSFGAVNYFSEDIINIFYAEGRYSHTFANKIGLLFAGQYSDQRSSGDNRLTGAPFFTNQVGIKGEVGYEGALMTLAYTVDANGANLINPWSSYPGYTSVQVEDFNRAGEEAFMIRLAYDFSRIRLEGLTATALWVHGWNRVDPATKASVNNEDEYDVDIQWRPKAGLLKGFWPRVRYGRVEQRDGSSKSINDLRVIVNYEISVL